jgi:hypothetical protein
MALSFATDIKPLFTAKDQEHMSFMFDLWDYDDVKSNADGIYDSVSAGRMPIDGGGKPQPWPKDQVAKFKQWMDEGSQP